MIAADHQRQRARTGNVGDAFGDLVKGLLQIGRDGEHIARIAQRHLFPQVHAHLVVIRRIKRRNPAHTLRPKARTGAVGCAAVERDAEHGGIIATHVADVLHVGCFEECVDPGEVRQLPAGEGRDGLVSQAV